MAGTVRKRTRTNRKGEPRVTWVADYFDQDGRRHNKTFTRQREAQKWLVTYHNADRSGPVLLRLDEIQKLPSAQCGIYFLFLDSKLQRIGQSTNIGRRLVDHRNNGIRFDDCRILHCVPEHLLMLEGLYVEKFRPPHNRELRISKPNLTEAAPLAAPEDNDDRRSNCQPVSRRTAAGSYRGPPQDPPLRGGV